MFKIPQKIEYIIEKLNQNGFEAYIVGGCVRDILLGITPHDYDITTSAAPADVIKVFKHTIPTGIKHGTVTVLIDNEPVEVTSFRTDGEYTDSRRPDSVKFVSNLKEDLARRDFTVNAMAYNSSAGLCDYFGGQLDLDNKILRAVGDPQKRFSEDALRILRLFRFASTLGFDIEKNTFSAAINCGASLEKISIERIMSELKAAVMGENFEVIKHLIECGGLSFLGLCECPDFEKIKLNRQNGLVPLYLLLKDADINKLKLSNNEKEYIKLFKTLEAFEAPQSKPDIKHILAISNPEITRDFLIYKGLDATILDEILNNNEPYLIGHLKITGNDLLAMGYKGEKIGEILKKLQNVVIEEPTKNTRARLLKEIM